MYQNTRHKEDVTVGPFTLLSIKRQLQLRIVIVAVIAQAVMLLPVGREGFLPCVSVFSNTK